MGKIIAVANPKGGVGKSTVSATLAAGFENRFGDVIAADTDPQQTLMDFSENARHIVSAVSLAGIETALIKLREKFSFVIVDTPSSRSQLYDLPRTKIISNADLIVIPLQPSAVDYMPTLHLINMIEDKWAVTKGIRPKAMFFLNRCVPRSSQDRKARELLSNHHDFLVAETTFKSWDSLATLALRGKTILDNKRLAHFGWDLVDETIEALS